ncbi:MAG: imelysin family protein [Devosia sp.]
MRLLLAASFALLSAPAFAAGAIPFHDMIAGAIDGYARPKFADFASTTLTLRTDVAALCATPSESTLQRAQDAFKSTVLAYSAIEFIRFGPLGVDNRVEQLLFWPDSKGIALRQVQSAVGTKDATAADPATLKGKSVAMQGLGAVEYLLFGTGFEDLKGEAGAYRCSFAAAATALIDGVASTLAAEWANTAPGGAADAMLNPTPTSSDYRSELEVINKLAGVLTFGTDTARDQRLSPVLSLSTGIPKPKSALFWRSNMSAKALGANFNGLRDFFRAAKFEAALGRVNDWIAKGAEFEFKGAIKAAAEVPGPMETAITDPQGLLGLKQMYVSTGSLDTLLGDSLGGVLGLTTGFSALDGD